MYLILVLSEAVNPIVLNLQGQSSVLLFKTKGVRWGLQLEDRQKLIEFPTLPLIPI
jgi:hypothetical protein